MRQANPPVNHRGRCLTRRSNHIEANITASGSFHAKSKGLDPGRSSPEVPFHGARASDMKQIGTC